ncbi:MAG: hypothetical protein JWO67_4499 [Streptosporangiaceae bacterium]|nr:hypothetical protein [Streptosporangiaceae bacterium]
MVGVAITENGVEFDPLSHVRVHPAAELFPLLQGAAFTELVNDIREQGLRDPIVFTPDGQLLDGRNRYRACRKIRDEEPMRRTEHSEPWAYVISTNMHRRHLSESQRAMIAAKIADRHEGQRGPAKNGPAGRASAQKDLPPTRQQAQEMLNVSHGSLGRARRVLENGTSALKDAVESGKVKVATADRIARDCNTDEQNEFVRKVNGGANPRNIAPPDMEASRRHAAEREARVAPLPRASGVSAKHRLVYASAVTNLVNTFEALDIVLSTATDGLDPSLTSEEAAGLLDGLSKSSGAYRRLLALLKQRKEKSTSDHH